MELSVLIFILTLYLKSSWSVKSVKCYRCDPERTAYNGATALCDTLDTNKDYVDCQYSTVCYSRTTSHDFGHGSGPTIAVEKGCAPQTLLDDQRKINNKWKPVKEVYEVYKDGCAEEKIDDARIPKTVVCFCHGDYCNTSITIKAVNFVVVTFLVLILRVIS